MTQSPFRFSIQVAAAFLITLASLSGLSSASVRAADGYADGYGYENLFESRFDLARTEQQVTSVVGDFDKKRGDLKLVLDGDGNITGMNDYISWDDRSNPSSVKTFSLKDIHDGFVIEKRSKLGISKDIVTLRAKDLSPHSGGEVVLKLLRQYKIFSSDDVRNFRVQVQRNASGVWSMSYSGQSGLQPFDSVFVVTRMSGGSAVGIEELRLSLAGQQVARINAGNMEKD